MTKERRDRRTAAERLRELAASAKDPQAKERFLDAAAEADGASLNGAGNMRATVDTDRRPK